MRRAKWLGLALAVLLAMLAVTALAEETAGRDVSPHNYILLIDNSRSTTGRHSLGAATDPSGLRFDAAKLVYQNVVTSAATGARGKLAVVVFCGTDNCVTYGPMDIDDPALDATIGSVLNGAANAGRRDDYTDIRTALQTARDMMSGFEGDTSVLLLTDGVNDLSNKSNPFTRTENIEANAQSVQLVQEMRDAGADIHILALTSNEDVDKSADFMTFINQLASAGGGEITEDGDYDNVLMATETDLNSKLVQTFIHAESRSEAIQTVVEYTPVNETFTVPYDGITDATVNITFMPEDKALLEKVELVAPDGVSQSLWDAEGIHEANGITVTEDRSYIMLAIPEPQVGDWNVVVTSRKVDGNDSQVLINAVVRFNHNLRLNVAMNDTAVVGEDTRIEAWFQKFNGETFEDLTDSDIYAQSAARLTLTTPGGASKRITMRQDGDRYTVVFRAKTPGQWKALLQVKNPYVQEKSDEIAFEVVDTAADGSEDGLTLESEPGPTAEPIIEATIEPAAELAFNTTAAPQPESTPEPTATPIPAVVPIESLTLSVEPSVTAESGETFITGDSAKLSWQLEGKADSVRAALEGGGNSLSIFGSGMSFPRSFFQEGVEYTFRVSAMPLNGKVNGAAPVVKTQSFYLSPDPIAAKDITLSVSPLTPDEGETPYVDREAGQVTLSWQVNHTTESVEAELLKDGEVWLTGLRSGDAIDVEQLEDGAVYQLRVGALPVNGTLAGIKPTVSTLDFELYPKPEIIEGLTMEVAGKETADGVVKVKGREAQLNWLWHSGRIEQFHVTATDAAGAEVVNQVFDGKTTKASVILPKEGDYDVTLSATPMYAAEDTVDTRVSVRIHAMSLLERFWYFIAGAGALLIAALAVLLIKLRKKKVPHVVGSLRVRCDALQLNQMLTLLEDKKGIQLEDPITRHPAMAEHKGSEAYKLLGSVRLNNATTDQNGLAPGERSMGDEPPHRPNTRVVRVTYTDPRTSAKVVRYVGRYDVVPASITIEDGEKSYEFMFSGS